MEYKVISNPANTSKDARYMIEEIKDKIFDELYMKVELDEYEILELIYKIIEEDTGENIKEYDLKVQTEEDKMYLDIINDYDLIDAEKRHLIKQLTKHYGKEVTSDIINPVIKQKLNTEHYYIKLDSYDEKLSAIIDIPLIDFGKKNEICRYLNMIE
jgi:hypothetical protein